ncbi:MAG: hypothetical protein AB7F86_12190 [Bdellovibrionales bacterium]
MNTVLQKAALLACLSISFTVAALNCDTDRKRRNDIEISYQNEKIAASQAELARLKAERIPHAALVQSSRDHLAHIEKSDKRVQDLKVKIEDAMATSKTIFDYMMASEAGRKQIAENLELIFRDLELAPGEFDKTRLQLGSTELATALGPFLSSKPEDDQSLLWRAGMLLIKAANSTDVEKIQASRAKFEKFYENIIHNLENQNLDNRRQTQTEQKKLADASANLAAKDAEIAGIEASINGRIRTRDGLIADNDKIVCFERQVFRRGPH